MAPTLEEHAELAGRDGLGHRAASATRAAVTPPGDDVSS